MTWKNQKPPSGIPARGAGVPATPRKPRAPLLSAENQPTPEAKSIGHAVAKTAREVAIADAVEAAKFMGKLWRNPKAPWPTRLDAANKIVERAEGRAAQAIGGDPNGVPVRTVISWEDE